MTTETAVKLIFTVGITSMLYLIGMGVGAIAGSLATWIEKRRANAKARKVIAALAEIAKDETLLQAEKVKADKKIQRRRKRARPHGPSHQKGDRHQPEITTPGLQCIQA